MATEVKVKLIDKLKCMFKHDWVYNQRVNPTTRKCWRCRVKMISSYDPIHISTKWTKDY